MGLTLQFGCCFSFCPAQHCALPITYVFGRDLLKSSASFYAAPSRAGWSDFPPFFGFKNYYRRSISPAGLAGGGSAVPDTATHNKQKKNP
jgi:hypothetical protein